MHIDFDYNTRAGKDIHVIIESYDKGCPAILRADPLDSYEGEPAELEWVAEYPDGSEVTMSELDWYEKQKIEEEAWRRIEEFEDFNF